MERIDYSRQQGIHLTYPEAVVVVGLGGTGFWVALLLAMSGCRQLHLFDNDVIESSNLNRLLATTADIGKPKTSVVKDLIVKHRPDATVICLGHLDEHMLDLLPSCYHMFDCTDDIRIQRMLYQHCQAVGNTYTRCGCEGTHVTVTNVVPTWSVGDDAQTGYAHAPSWIVPALESAVLGVANAMYNSSIGKGGDIGNER